VPTGSKPPPGPLTIEVASILRGVAARKSITNADLSKTVGVSTSQLSKVMRGEKQIDMDLLDALCMALGTEITDLLREAEEAVAAKAAN
jgi:DNA-binding Xre family transcriptional regulator